MRIHKLPDKIFVDDKSGRFIPFRVLLLDENELAKVKAIYDLPPNAVSEHLLQEILNRRDLGDKLYPDDPKDEWSGYCKLDGNKLILL